MPEFWTMKETLQALRPGCFNEPVLPRLRLQSRRLPGLLVVAVSVAAICIAMPLGTMARPQQPVLPAHDAQSHVQGASQSSQSFVESASAGSKNSEWRGVVHSRPEYGSNDQLGRSVVYSSDPEATWLNQRTSRVEKPSQPPTVHQPPPPTAPLGASLQAVATQLMAHVASPSPSPPPSSSPSPGSQPSRQPDPAVRMESEDGFQGIAEPLDVTHHDTPSSPKPPSSVLPSSLKPQHQRPMPLTTIQPQPSTTASERISTWILLSGPHGTSTTPSATTFTSIPPSGSSTTASSPQKKSPPPSTQSPAPSAKPVPQKAAAKRPASPAPPQPTRKPAAFTKKPPTTTTAAPSSTTPPAELVKISEAVITSLQKSKLPATAAEQTMKKPGKANNATALPKRPTTASTPSATTATTVTPVPIEKTKVSTATVPFTPALAFRRRPADSKHRATTVAPISSTTSSSTTLAPTTIEESTTLPSTIPDDLVTTTKRPKRPSSSHKKNKKKKKNRRRRPAKKTTTAVATTKPESKIGHDSNMSKPGQNGISTKIYNYLAREVMPSVSVGIIGLVVTAGLAGLFLYPFGGGVAARRHDEHLGPHGRLPPDRNYYYERDYPPMANEGSSNNAGKAEEEVIGQVLAGMQQPENRFGYGPPIYGGGNSGPPDAQYSDSYDKSQVPASDPEEDRPGEGEVKTYADPSPISTVPDSLQKTRYDVATPVDQVDITYPPTKKEESPYVVGSISADEPSRYLYTGNANATVENAEENPKTAGSRYSVRVSGESGQVAVGYGAQSGATGSVENADLGSSLELTYSGTGGAQPRRLKSHRRRRRQVVANLVDSKQNELDGPIPEDKKVFFTSTTPEITTEIPTTMPVTEEMPTTTTFVAPVAREEGVTTSTTTTTTTTSSSSSSPTPTAKNPSSAGTVFNPPPPPTTEDPLASLVNLVKRLAEYKLRLGANFLRGTSDAVTRYLGGVARRMEAAVAHLSDNRARRRSRRWEPFHVPTSNAKQDRAPTPSRLKHILKKATLTKKLQ